jgi:phosphate starvation-inducible PhoH-like protein
MLNFNPNSNQGARMGQSTRKRKLIERTDNILKSNSIGRIKQFYLEFLTDEQKHAWDLFQQSDVLFLIGPAGTGKTHLAVAFALHEILEKSKDKILLSRPVVEAGENLGFLPGDIDEKVYPYMLPLYDALDKMCGRDGDENRKYINSRVELAPLAYLRGRTFDDSVCLLDEAQNCTKSQLKLFLTRLGRNSKMIITGDPSQSDLGRSPEILDVISKLKGIEGCNTMVFTDEAIVRHPLVGQILKRLA